MRAVGLILAGGNSRKMRELIQKSGGCDAGSGKLSCIDFVLSNMTILIFRKLPC